jgi:hypothetical protein
LSGGKGHKKKPLPKIMPNTILAISPGFFRLLSNNGRLIRFQINPVAKLSWLLL